MNVFSKPRIKIAHSPDSDDAFMFYAMKENKVGKGNYDYVFGSAEIEALNKMALDKTPKKSTYDVFAISFHAYAYLYKKYQILLSGASMGSKSHGPRLVASEKVYNDYQESKSLEGMKIAIPGELTSANLVLQIIAKENKFEFVPEYCSFNQVFELLDEGIVSAALLIHESQLKFADKGYKELINLGSWWAEYSEGLNMPLGTNVIRRDLEQNIKEDVATELRDSINYAVKHFDESLRYARAFSDNGLDDKKAKEYIDMYVNDSTIKLSDNDLKSINLLFKAAIKHELLKVNEEIVIDPL